MANGRRPVVVSFIGAVCLALPLLPVRSAFAACSSMPPGKDTFRGAKGQVDGPFVVPGDHAGGSVWVGNGGRVELTIDGCPAPKIQFDKQEDMVAVVFTPPSGPRNVLLLAHDCTGADKTACKKQLQNGGNVECEKATILVGNASNKASTLAFDMPALSSVSGLPNLTGPATIIVTKKNQPRCDIGGGAVPDCKSDNQPNPPLFCVDDLFQDPCTSATKHSVFPNFTVLPELNDFQKLCRDSGDQPNCLLGNTPVNLQFAIDKRGNALMPVKWTGVLRGKSSAGTPCPPDSDNCDRRKLRGYTALDPFPADPAKDVITLPATVQVKSFNMKGGKFEPTPAITAGLSSDNLEFRLEGEAHKGKSVLRIPSCDDTSPNCTPNTFFDFTGRMEGSVGPISIIRAGNLPRQEGICEQAGAGDQPPTGPRKRCQSDGECGSGLVCAGFRAFAGQHK